MVDKDGCITRPRTAADDIIYRLPYYRFDGSTTSIVNMLSEHMDRYGKGPRQQWTAVYHRLKTWLRDAAERDRIVAKGKRGRAAVTPRHRILEGMPSDTDLTARLQRLCMERSVQSRATELDWNDQVLLPVYLPRIYLRAGSMVTVRPMGDLHEV
jgi:hypothetical protein